MQPIDRHHKKKGRDYARPFKSMLGLLVLDRAVQVERALATGAVVDAVDRGRRQRLQVLWLERGRVAALVVEDRSVREERRAAVRATVGCRIASRRRGRR